MSTSCRLPTSDRSHRAADFRALFESALIGRERFAGGVRWILRALPDTKVKSCRLADLETRCCDGLRFDIVCDETHVVWHISGPASAEALLDVFYELPLMVGDDSRAFELWAALDAAACGSPKGR